MSYLPTRRLFLTSVVLSLLVVLTLVACAAGSPEGATPAAPPEPIAPPPPTPLPRGGNLTIRLAAAVPELRPWQPRSRGEEQIIELLYNGLMRLDDQLRPQPDMAERWDASADGRLITFTLRPDVTWHDGRPADAADVVFTINALRAISPTTALLTDLGRIADIRAPTTATVVVSLTERYAPIFSSLAVPVLPRHLLDGKNLANLNFWEIPIGTGPFGFDTRDANTITLVANPNYYRGPPLLDRVAFLLAPDPQVAAAALRDGRLLLAELPWDVWRPFERDAAGTQTGIYSENGYYFLAYNLRDGRPFADQRVRQALAHAIDVPRLVQEVTDDRAIPIGSSAMPGSWADLAPPPTSTIALDRARTLLDEAGWRETAPGGVREREGRTLAGQLFVRGDDARRVAAAERIAGAAQTIGISLTVQPADFETVIRSKYAPPYDFDMLLGSWSNGAGDPTFADSIFYDPSDFALFHSSQISQGPADIRPVLNITGFRDPAYDNQASAARQLYDLERRSQALRLAQLRIAELQPYLFLWADQFGVALSPRVTTLDGPVYLDTPVYLGSIERWYVQ